MAASDCPAAPTASLDPVGSQDVAGATEGRCKTPILLVVGMAGSGKTTLVNALACYLDENEFPALARAETLTGAGSSSTAPAAIETEGGLRAASANDSTQSDSNDGKSEEDWADGAYVVNLDPAVLELPYEPNVDIRDTVKYKDVMREYSLGPNGAIITSLNLFATRFDQVLDLIQKRAPECSSVIIDTPGQIETFTWSASGAIITESLASVLPTVVLYTVDTARSESAMTFVSNMLYACSIMYKTRLPMVIVFNKIDVTSSAFAEAWMRDFDSFDAALKEDNFAGTLARSMAQALEEFYSVMRCVSVSAATEEGLDELMAAVTGASQEYEQEYLPALEIKRTELAEQEKEKKEVNLAKLRADLESEKRPRGAQSGDTAWAPGEVENGSYVGRSPLDPPAGATNDVHPGEGSRQMQKLRRSIVSGEDTIDGEDGAEEEVDQEDAQAYADFVKYLEALNIGSKARHGKEANANGDDPSKSNS